ncbi:glycosyl hydrolase [Xylariaceae sp. FL0255]|nr:glycosyl hydrolase [Xylariaceae sp. FL0255]
MCGSVKVGQSADNISDETPMMYLSTDLVNWENLGAQSTVSAMWRPNYVQSTKVYLPLDSYSYSDTAMRNRGRKVAAGASEAPGLFYANGVYFLICSAKTGWTANLNKVFWATSIARPWTGGSDIASESTNTYGSQNTFELTISVSSNYVWLPMAVDTNVKTVTLDYYAMWAMDVNTGVISSAEASKRYNSSEMISRGTDLDSDQMVLRNISGTGEKEWVVFDSTVNKPDGGDAYIIVNKQPAVNLSSLNSRAGCHHLVPVQLKLRRGEDDTIIFGSVRIEENFEITLHGIETYAEA